MKNNKTGFWVAILMTIILSATLSLWPSFRTAAQTKDKPAAKESKSGNNPRSKSAPHISTGKNAAVDQQDIENAMKEVEKAMKQLKEQEWPKVQLEIEKAMKDVDMAKIQQEVQAAMKEVDMEKVKLQVEAAMKQVDMAKIQAEIQNSLKEVDAAKIQAEVAKAMKEIDMKNIEKELAAVKNINTDELKKQMEQLKIELSQNKLDIKLQMDRAGEEMKKARAQLELVKAGLDELEKDGLKKKGEKVNIEYKEGIMYLNGAAQSKQVSDKYKKYFGEGNHKINFENDNNNNDRNNDNNPDNANGDIIK